MAPAANIPDLEHHRFGRANRQLGEWVLLSMASANNSPVPFLKAHPLPAELIIGANGYLGQYLARARRGADCLLHSRAPLNPMALQTGLPSIQEDLLVSHHLLAATAPQTVYLLARPITQSAPVLLTFLHNVQTLLRQWAD